jgi:hypothetical protein
MRGGGRREEEEEEEEAKCGEICIQRRHKNHKTI